MRYSVLRETKLLGSEAGGRYWTTVTKRVLTTNAGRSTLIGIQPRQLFTVICWLTEER